MTRRGKPLNINQLRAAADRVAVRLLGALKRGEMAKICLEDIEEAVRKDPGCPKDIASHRHLITLAVRRTVERTEDK